MTQFHSAIEGALDQASTRWRVLSFLRQSVIVGIVVAGLMLLLGVALTCGWLTSEATASLCLLLLSAGALLAWIVIGIRCAAAAENRLWLAASLEQVHAPLMDRVNTLVSLEQQGSLARHPYTEPIQRQARKILAATPPMQPFPVSSIRAHYGVLATLVLVTLLFYGLLHPWQHLRSVAQQASTKAPEDPSLEIPPPEQPLPQPKEKEPPWGEIRITRPGTNLRAAPTDVVPLHIEAAANRPIAQVEWVTAVSGGPESRHPLEQPKEPRFALYDPELDLKNLGAGKSDVLSYYAQATCADGARYQSDLYFIELFPIEEEPQPSPVEAESTGYDVLQQLTAMIERQEEVIRRTRGQERPVDQAVVDRKTRREALAHEEADLSSTARHLSADVEGQYEEPAAGAMSRSLEQAQSTLEAAENALRQASQDHEALPQETAALAALTAARKQFQELLHNSAKASEKLTEAQTSESQEDPLDFLQGLQKLATALAADNVRKDAERRDARLAGKLAEMQKREQQIQSARECVQKTLNQQRQIEQQAASGNAAEMPQLAQRQQDLQRSLEQFTKNNRPCSGSCQKECAGAQAAMGRAASSMGAGRPDAGQLAGQAGAQLQALDDALERQQGRNQLAEAHQLKRALDHQIDQLQQAPQQGSSPGGLEAVAGQCKSLTSRLKAIADEKPSRDWFGEPLRQALSGEKKQQLDFQCDRLGQAQGSANRRQASGQLQQGLQEVSRAFDASCPSLAGRKQGRPKPEGQDEALATVLGQLGSLARRQAGSRPQQQDQGPLGQAALASIQASAPALYGYNEQTREVIARLKEALKHPETPLDVRLIQSLTEEIQRASRELAAQGAEKKDESQKTYIDPSRLPPAYRKSIETYFQKLSQQP